MKIGVTGATGFIGRNVANGLGARGKDLRLVVRDATRAPAGRWGVRSTGGYFDRIGNVSALRGVDVLFMVSAHEGPDRVAHHRKLIEAAVEARVRHIVYTSFAGAAPDAVFTLARDHWATEQAIRDSGLEFTFLRDCFYLDFLPDLAVDGVIAGPAGDGRVAAVARLDVAASAVAVLSDPAAHAGVTYNLTGPAAVSLAEVAEALTTITHRPTRYVNQTLEEARASRDPRNVPAWQLDAWVSTYTAIAAGELDVVSDDVERLTGTAPMDLVSFLRRDNPPTEALPIY